MNGDPTTSHDTPCATCQCQRRQYARWLHALRDSPLWQFLTNAGTPEQRAAWSRA